MEICKIKISKELIQQLINKGDITTNDFEVVGVDENSFDYSNNEVWKALKEKSDKAFKELKKAEFNIRNNI